MNMRIETDTIGQIEVPIDKYWGAQTQRSIENFDIGSELMPDLLLWALVLVKRTAALANGKLGLVPGDFSEAIVISADQILSLFSNSPQEAMSLFFPLKVWQTGSGTQTNMNVNEVLANLASEMLGAELGKRLVHPNDHVNLGQSSNDIFPTAMHIAAVHAMSEDLIPAMQRMHSVLQQKEMEFNNIIKVGRTHMQDAVPMTLGQEFSGYAEQIKKGINRSELAVKELLGLALGGTAVGTGLNTSEEFVKGVVDEIRLYTGYPFYSVQNKFEALAANDSMVEASGMLNVIATSLMKISNDIRLLSSGPRCGLGELILPVNEPGSSIMPGKTNPTQCEAMTMVCCQVIGNHTTITVAGMQGHLELNVFKPVIIYNFLQSVRLLADAIWSFTNKAIIGIIPNLKRIQELLNRSLMVVTALTKHIGYDKAAQIGKYAYEQDVSLEEANLVLGFCDPIAFKEYINPVNMLR